MRMTFLRVGLTLVVATSAQAQISSPGRPVAQAPSIDASRIGFGIAAQRSLPNGALRTLGAGNGAAAYLSYNLDTAGRIAIRAEMGLFDHSEARTDLIVPRFDGETFAEASLLTSSRATCAGVGVQFRPRLGFLRPNLTLSYNRVKFETESYVDNLTVESDIIYLATGSDISYAWTAGAGIDISLDSRSLAILDLGARYTFGGEGSWLHDGDIRATGPDSYEVSPSRGSIQYFSLALGLRLDLIRMLQ